MSDLLSIHYDMQYSFIWYNPQENKRESCLRAKCRLLFWIQQLSVGCSIFLIVASFIVQFYATFTWMFMTLVPQKFRNYVDRDFCATENKSGKSFLVFVHFPKTIVSSKRVDTSNKHLHCIWTCATLSHALWFWLELWLVSWECQICLRTLDGSKHTWFDRFL